MKRLHVIGGVWLLSLVLVGSCQQSGEQTVPTKESMSSAGGQGRGVVTELLIEDVVLGKGAEAAADASVRDRAAQRLLAAFEVGHDPLMLIHAAEQHIAAARGVLPDREAASGWLVLAAAEAGRAHAAGRLAGGQLALEALDGQSLLGGSETEGQAIELAERLCREDPSAAMKWIDLGHLQERAGHIDAAREAWRVASLTAR